MRQIVEISSAFLGLLVLLGSSDATAANGESLNFRPEQYDTELVYSWPKTPAISTTSKGKSASQAIESMEGVEEFVPPRIPTVFILADQGQALSRHLKSRVHMAKVGADGLEMSKPIQSTVVFHCNEEFQTRKSMCQSGDAVDVKLWVKSTTFEPSRMPSHARGSSSWDEFQMTMAQAMTEQSTSLRLLRAHVLDVFPKNGSLLVQWMSEQEQDPILGSIPGMKVDEEAIALVPLGSAFRDGVLCSSAPNAFIEKLLEPMSCQAEFLVHVSALCADGRLAPEQNRPAQAIACIANASMLEGQMQPR